MLDDNVIAELVKPLDPARITTFSQGPQKGVRYLEGEDVIRTANRIFGYGGWGYRLVSPPTCVEEGRQGTRVQDDGSVGTFYQVWTAHVEVSVEGATPIADLGTNTRQGTGAASLEMAIKGAVTDGIKRCLKTFGDQFGLVLYDKDVSMRDLQEAHGDVPAPKPDTGWWTGFQEACRRDGVTAAGLAAVLGQPPSLKSVQAWIEAGEGRHWSNLVAEAKRKEPASVG